MLYSVILRLFEKMWVYKPLCGEKIELISTYYFVMIGGVSFTLFSVSLTFSSKEVREKVVQHLFFQFVQDRVRTKQPHCNQKWRSPQKSLNMLIPQKSSFPHHTFTFVLEYFTAIVKRSSWMFIFFGINSTLFLHFSFKPDLRY